MKIVSRFNRNVLNSAKTATMQELSHLFEVAPNMAAKTIRLFPHYSVSFFTEGLGEIYDVNNAKNIVSLNKNAYKWKVRGAGIPNIKFATRVTGGAISAGSTVGTNGQKFIVAFESSYYNPRDIVKLENGQKLFILSNHMFMGEGVFEYTARLNTNDPTKTLSTTYLVAGKESGPAGNAYPELSDKGYISDVMSAEEHINYLTKVRYDWSWSADAAATMYMIEDTVNLKGKMVKQRYVTDKLWMNALEKYEFNKEMELIYGETTMDAFGKCFYQDPDTGQDIVKGDGIINQLHASRKQTYTSLSLGLFEDILTDMALQMPSRTGNRILVTTGMQGYKAVGQMLRTAHQNTWVYAADQYVRTKGGKIELGAHYNAYTFQGNTIVFAVNNVFDHPANVSGVDSNGYKLESHKFLFLDTSSYDGVPNMQMIAKNGRSFVTGELDGIGGQDGKTSGKVGTLLDGSAKSIIGTLGLVLHNPYSSFILEKKII